MNLIRLTLLALFIFNLSQAKEPTPLNFSQFRDGYLKSSDNIIQAQRNLTLAENQLETKTDVWKSQLNLTPQVNFATRQLDTIPSITSSWRAKNISATYSQLMPTGTSFQLKGTEYIEKQNPLLSSLDSDYSAQLSQDLFKNSFGYSQRSQTKKAELDYKIAQIEFTMQTTKTCQEAFSTYVDAYIYQQRLAILKKQLQDAEKALKSNRRLHRNRLIQKVDLLSSESDFLQSQIQTQKAEQLFKNAARGLEIFLGEHKVSQLLDPSPHLGQLPSDKDVKTLTEKIAHLRYQSQDHEVDRVRSDRWSEIQLGLQLGQRKGRLSTGSALEPFEEKYLNASLNFSFDIINKTEDSALQSALQIRNQFEVIKERVKVSQDSVVKNLLENQNIFSQQVETSKKRIQLLDQKAKLAFEQMQKARLDFENYLLHRNAFRNEQLNFLSYQKDLWMNHFALQGELISEEKAFCGVSI
ncbi:MAG: TolC family protein [Bdellovibrionales bacterium]|nr:TolC family protein [Bdellovibrionales bacterium]